MSQVQIVPDDVLDVMQVRAESLLRLLKDRHPGLMTWNLLLADAIVDFRSATERLPTERFPYAQE